MLLYKYLNADRLDVLSNSNLRFSSPLVLNDPFELKPHFHSLASDEDLKERQTEDFPKLIAEEFNAVKNQIELNDFIALSILARPKMIADFPQYVSKSMPYVNKYITSSLENMLGILCLSELRDSLLMWAHYADAHQGFVIGFNSNSAFFSQRQSDSSDIGFLEKVKYSDIRPSLSLGEVRDLSCFMTKADVWKYEKEWRMVMPLNKADKIIGDGPTAVHLFSFPKAAVHSIIIGSRTPENIKSKILKIITQDDGYREASVIQASVDEKHYQLNFTPIKG